MSSAGAGPAEIVRAAVFTGPGRPVRVTDVELAAPREGEVAVDIVAAGVCHSDLHVVRGEWPIPTPTVLGHEGAGVVSALGPGVTDLAVGDHVVLSWVAGCGSCRYCRDGRPVQCARFAEVVAPHGVLLDGSSRLSLDGRPAYHYLGVSSFSERVVVPVSGAVKVRRDAPLDLVALVGCAVATGVGAVENTARVPSGATVAVIGCGGVGLSCIQGARLAGAARIIAVDMVEDKLRLARRLGATDVIRAGQGDVVDELGSLVPEGLDYVFDAIGKVTTTEQAIAALGLGGAAVIVGLPPAGSTARFDPLSLAERDQRILGSNYGSVDPHRDIPRLVDLFMDGSIDLESMVSSRRPLAEAAQALDDLASGRALRQLLMTGIAGDTLAAQPQPGAVADEA
jgi:S-(hydroxymethyl)glutathione dehydrogenase / alcohol dehydrogenase